MTDQATGTKASIGSASLMGGGRRWGLGEHTAFVKIVYDQHACCVDTSALVSTNASACPPGML